ncbi:MAG: PEGA domain-containing protein [Lentisphaeria bacterium]|nr:PEGA domain-containing protein [Lentisphaeria bacterium]
MMKIRAIKGECEGQVLDLKPFGFVLGRAKDNDLVLADEDLSRRHCRISESGGKWLVEDLESMNGVWVNGKRIEGPTELKVGDRFTLCSQEFMFTDTDAPPPVADVAVPAEPDEAATVLPLGKIALLAAMALLIAFLGFMVLPGSSSSDKDKAVSQDGGAGTGEETSGVEKISDDELSKLIEDEETRPEGTETGKPGGNGDSWGDQQGGATTTAPKTAATGGGEGARQPGGRADADETGRAPVSLILVQSDPPGAAVFLDGENVGTTPFLLRKVPSGRRRLKLTLDGYDDLERQIHVPDLLPGAPYKLSLRPNTALVTSKPIGAGVWRGTQFLGNTPLVITGLAVGEYELTVVASGFETARRKVTASDVAGVKVHVDLVDRLGGLEIVTTPAGCQVLLDDTLAGVTEVDPESAGTGRLLLPNILIGDRQLRVDHPSGVSRRGRITIARGETKKQFVGLWVPDTRITLRDGREITGMLVARSEGGDVVVSPSVKKKSERFFKEQIAKTETLTAEQSRQCLEQLRDKTHAKDVKAEGGWGDAEGKPEKGADKPAAHAPIEISVANLHKQFRSLSKTALSRHYAGRKIALHGVPSSSAKDGMVGCVKFGRQIRCYLKPGLYEGDGRASIRAAIDAKTPITIQGTAVGITADFLVVRDCSVGEIKKKGNK